MGEWRVFRTTAAPWVTEVILVLLLLLIGGFLRFHRLEELPPRLSADEYTTTTQVFEILSGKGPPLFGLDWKPMPALTSHVTALLMRLTGPTILGVRILSILLSVICALTLFKVLCWSCPMGVAWSATVVLLSNPWFLNFSRSGWENMHVATYWVLFSWCFLSGLRTRDNPWPYHLGAGLFLALSFYGYFSGRLILFVWLIYFPIAHAMSGRSWRDVLVAYAIVAATGFVLFAPQVPAILHNWDFFQQRVRAVSIFGDDPARLGFANHASMALYQIGYTIRYLLVGGPIAAVLYSPPERPPVHPVLVPFLLLGMARALIRWREGAWWWLLALLPVVITQGFSAGTPDLGRMAGTCVVFFWFIGYGGAALVESWPLAARPMVSAVLGCGALLLSVQEWRYFEPWMLSEPVTRTRGAGVDYRDYKRWQEMQFQRILAGQAPIHVTKWEPGEQSQTVTDSPAPTAQPFTTSTAKHVSERAASPDRRVLGQETRTGRDQPHPADRDVPHAAHQHPQP